jgi:hypothetical protein
VRAERIGLIALAIVLFLWLSNAQKDNKENARGISAALASSIKPGELVISSQPEQVPVFRYYLGPGLRFATTIGPVPDAQIFDWRDAVKRLRDADPKGTLDSLVDSVPVGGQFVYVSPVFRSYGAWDAKWTKLVWQRSGTWRTLLGRDPRLRLVRHVWTNEIALRENYFKLMQAFVYQRVR